MTSSFLFCQHGNTWHDVNKSYVDDSNMCWAATAANVLAWGGWITHECQDAQSIYDKIVQHWTNGAGYQTWVWRWWLTGEPPPHNLYATIDVAGGGGYFPEANFWDKYFAASRNIMQWIEKKLWDGCGISLVITKGTATHALTCWGIGSDCIYVTDSDNLTECLKRYHVITKDNQTYLTDNYAGWRISGIYALAGKDSGS